MTKDLNYALVEAAEKGDLNQVKELLEQGADVNSNGLYGYKALGEAAGKGHVGVVHFLLEQKADVNGLDRLNYTALEKVSLGLFAEKNKLLATAEILLDHGANVNHVQSQYISNVNKFYCTDKGDLMQSTALTLAISWNMKLIPLLLERGANPNVYTINPTWSDDDHYAWSSLYVTGFYNSTALHQITNKSCKDISEPFNLLVKYGADYTLTDSNGKTALQLLKEKGCAETESLIAVLERQEVANSSSCKSIEGQAVRLTGLEEVAIHNATCGMLDFGCWAKEVIDYWYQ